MRNILKSQSDINFLIFQNHDKKGMINDGNSSNRKTNLI